MKLLLFTVPAFCLALGACQPAEQEMPQDQGTAEAPPTLGSEDAGQGAGSAAEQPSSSEASRDPAPSAATGPTEYAEAEILPTEGQTAGGLIKLTRAGDEVTIEGTVTGLDPGAHGFHIHEKGDCSAPDASSAGGHFEPADDPHGAPQDPPGEHHLGDFGNITAGENGEAEVNVSDPEIRMSGPDSVIGKAFVVHAGRDDLETQPSGDSGARVGCGVIRALEVAESSSTTI